MQTIDNKTECRTPTSGKSSTWILSWKFDLIRENILKILELGSEGVLFKDLPEKVIDEIDDKQVNEIGSISWHTTKVKLELEVRGEIERIPESKPQRLRIKS